MKIHIGTNTDIYKYLNFRLISHKLKKNYNNISHNVNRIIYMILYNNNCRLLLIILFRINVYIV